MSVSSVVLDLAFAWLSRGNTDANVKSTTLGRSGEFAIPAASRRQFRHRQSSPLIGIGSRTDSSLHQQGPESVQVNSVPQREQTT